MPSVDEPFTLVIFGASGDLTQRKLIPALFALYASRTLPEPFAVVGVARTEMSEEDFRRRMREAVIEHGRVQPASENVWERFTRALHYVPGDPKDPAVYGRLKELLQQLERAHGGPENRLFYCATPPSLYDDIVEHLGAARLSRSASGWTRIVVEKPFGQDLDSARALNRQLVKYFREEQIYRIDHYLGKETVQNLMVFRFANGIFEPLWNRNHVAHIQITVAESIGVENRGAYYEEAGALRDMVQNHLLQLLCLIAMEPPVTFDAGPVRDEKNKVLQAVRPIDPAKVDDVALRAQYGAGYVGTRAVPGYRQEKGVKPDSTTETYAALRLQLDNWRWAGVPFYLRTGKRLARRVSEIAIRFHRTPHMIFRRRSETGLIPNVLLIRIQPDEGISLTVAAKEPGPDLKLGPVRLDFKYNEVFGGEPPEAYERLLLDVIHGDATLFARGDWVERAWELLQPIIDAWGRTPAGLPVYEAGSWGPAEADAFIARDGDAWRNS
jgi:glucose-6-phosphate 1-dehydrogenase